MLELSKEFNRLNPEQKTAILHHENTVVLAGPGSGKTQTLVLKICYLLSESIRPPRGLACITYNNDTVREFRNRLACFGVHPGPQVFLGTVHSFCLNCVVRPFAPLLIEKFREGIQVAATRRAAALRERAVIRVSPGSNPQFFETSLTRLRRRTDCGEDTSGFGDEDKKVLDEYLKMLEDGGFVDFDGMVSLALRLIRTEQWICDLLSARFPWLVVDEYQDLGGPLHQIVTTLLDTEIKAFVVGDPDQTIYDFTGASPEYLMALTARKDFKVVELKFNYRSGERLIAASQAALALIPPRQYLPDPQRKDVGDVLFHKAGPLWEDHVRVIFEEVLPEIRARNIAPENTAILYRGRGEFLQLLQKEMEQRQVPFLAEREGSYPRDPMTRWLQECAGLGISGIQPGDFDFEALLSFYQTILVSAGVAEREPNASVRRILLEFLEASGNPQEPLPDWLRKANAILRLEHNLRLGIDRSEDLEAFQQLLVDSAPSKSLASHRLVDFARDGRLEGRIVVTTLHSSKGRQFDAVIIPGLVEGVLPTRRWNRTTRNYDEPSTRQLREDRRLFYVGFTRARKVVFLIWGNSYQNTYGYSVELGKSRFVSEIETRLGHLS